MDLELVLYLWQFHLSCRPKTEGGFWWKKKKKVRKIDGWTFDRNHGFTLYAKVGCPGDYFSMCYLCLCVWNVSKCMILELVTKKLGQGWELLSLARLNILKIKFEKKKKPQKTSVFNGNSLYRLMQSNMSGIYSGMRSTLYIKQTRDTRTQGYRSWQLTLHLPLRK